MFNDTVTIYNRYNEMYFRTILDGVYWLETDNYDAPIQRAENEVQIIIPERAGYIEKYSGQSGTWSLKSGDIIIRGRIPEISRAKDLEEYDYKIIKRIIKATVNSCLSHWEVFAK